MPGRGRPRKRLSDFPALAAEWDATKNVGTPAEIFAFSSASAWWQCQIERAHQWMEVVATRTRSGSGCPACGEGKKARGRPRRWLSDYPEVASQWHPTKNAGRTSAETYAFSSDSAWWMCPLGHEYEVTAEARTRHGTGCPACGEGKRARGRPRKLRSLADYPSLAAEGHATRDAQKTPAQSARTTLPKRAEVAPTGAARVRSPRRLLSDFPALAAEWHPKRNAEKTPSETDASSWELVWWQCPVERDHEYREAVSTRIREGATCPACLARKRLSEYLSAHAADVSSSSGARSLTLSAESHSTKKGGKTPAPRDGHAFKLRRRLSDYPALALQWHPTKNAGITPKEVYASSSDLFWWRCLVASDHEWTASVAGRTRKDAGCPSCAGIQASSTNSLGDLSPKTGLEWHPFRNGELTRFQVVAASDLSRWWKCSKGHEWEATVVSRTTGGGGCPKCYDEQNPLSVLFPNLAHQWHPTKNAELKPEQVPASSKDRAWWRCSKNAAHEWEATIASRTTGRRGCPRCFEEQSSTTNSLAALFPALAAEWHPTKNGLLPPSAVRPYSGKKRWWKCSMGEDHEWEAAVLSRTSLGTGCPRCNKGWTVSGVRAFVESLLPHIDALSPAERYAIFQQGGLLDTQGKSRGFVKALATGRFPRHELEKFAAGVPSLVDAFLADRSLTLEGIDGARGDEVDSSLELAPPVEPAKDEAPLPVVQARDALAVLDHHLVASADEEAAAFLVASARGKLWRHVYLDEAAAVTQARAHQGGAYSAEVRDSFLEEYGAATSLVIPKEYSFSVDGKPTPPNLMQRLVAVRVRDLRRYGNWSGAGAGKTLSAVLATRVVGARLTVICCPNSVVGNWVRVIRQIFPDSAVAEKSWTPRWVGNGPRFLVLNYEHFQQPDSETALKSFLTRETVAFVVIDEIHYAKQRYAEEFSRRKRLVMGLITAAQNRSPGLCVLGMSATPVINNLQEGRSLIELVTGVEHAELDTRATIPNCMRLYQRLVALGTRWRPDYAHQLEERVVEVDCTAELAAIRALGRGQGPLDLERILTRVRLPAILAALEPGRKTLLYTHYVEGIDKLLFDAVSATGLKAGLYTGDDKTGLEGFLHGDVDVLIGSSAIGTGVDGLQHVCDQLIINVLPWTHAEYEQLVGRVYRQGQRSNRVQVVIPTTFAVVNGERWSYCDSKLARIHFKKSIADAAVDGAVPEGNLRSPAQAQADVMAWLERLDRGQAPQVARRPITVPLDGHDSEIEQRRLANFGDFAAMNARWNTSTSTATARRLATDSEEWERYHSLYRKARETWTVVPFQEAISWAKRREGYVIGDFGCGEALLAAAVSDRHVVHSFDHVAINDRVLAGDMAHVPLDNDSLDVAVFSLSLMGANFTDYVREAHRTLKLDGLLLLWESRSRFEDPVAFCRDLERLGFRVPMPEERGPFVYIEARKTERLPDPEVCLRF